MANIKKITAASLLCAAMVLAPAAGVCASAASASSPSVSSEDRQWRPDHHNQCGSLCTLSKITGMSVEDLVKKYPQQTAWQIAYKLGKLDELKKAFLAEKKIAFDDMAGRGIITKEDSRKMYEDLEKRLAAVDGKNTVILGRPGYRPKIGRPAR